MSKKMLWVLAAMMLVVVLAACGGGESGGMPADAALKVTGNVDKEMGWAEDDVRAMDTIEAESTNKDGETSTYTGVPIMALLDKAGVKDGATTVAFVADDGYTADVSLDDVKGCADCIVSFRNQGGFSIVMPGFPGNVQVKGVVEIQVK
ncbi:MAG: molybdopterin-dependent oxidoreductase [Anaerolineae bacterium]|nr:molybdopterin-dependent oxidoreductase [Anaerolineae bacterium]